MGTERFDELDNLLHHMPLPQLNQDKSDKMFTRISEFNKQFQAQPGKQRKMSRWGIRFASLAAAVLLLFFAGSYFGVFGGKEANHPLAGQVKNGGDSEGALTAKEAKMEVVKKWAEGVKERDGKMQYEQFSTELKEKYKKVFEDAHWSTGVSSPWVKSYGIYGESDAYKVVFHMATSTGDAENLGAIVYLKKAGDHWVISRTSSSTQYLNYNLTSQKDDKTLIREFRAKEIHSKIDLAKLSITLLGIVDDFRVYNVPSNVDANVTSFKAEGYEFPPASQTDIIGVKDGKVFTIGEMIHDGSINVKKLYEILPLDLRTGDEAGVLQPQAVVTQWANGVKNRDGKQQFKMLSTDLQKKYKGIFTENHWSTGTSSPWVKSFSVIKDPSQAKTYNVTFQMTSSTGDAGKENVVVHLQQVSGKWVITEVTSDTKEFNLNLNARG